MPRHRLDLAYDGTGFHGYARQEGQRTVQGELERGLEMVVGEKVETVVAGRTDAGVHAHGQVVSFDTGEPIEGSAIRSLNGLIGPEIVAKSLITVGDDFHARFSATWRRYRYTIDHSGAPDPLSRHEVWAVKRPLDLEAMAGVSEAFLGEHDFGAFCRSVDGKSNVRVVTDARWDTDEEGLLRFWIQANAFCQQMVRSIVGFCYDVGRGFTQAGSVARVIASRDRSAVATVAPPHGLTLWEVGY